jgi:hypothetical protein
MFNRIICIFVMVSRSCENTRWMELINDFSSSVKKASIKEAHRTPGKREDPCVPIDRLIYKGYLLKNFSSGFVFYM